MKFLSALFSRRHSSDDPREDVPQADTSHVVSASTEELLDKRRETSDQIRDLINSDVVEDALKSFRDRFLGNSYMHEGCEWSRVQMALEANPEALRSIAQMEEQGHEPDIYNFDDNGFDIGTCSEEAPLSTRNCTYSAEAEKLMKKKFSDRVYNGSAIEAAKAMGIQLMPLKAFRKIVEKKVSASLKFETNSVSYLANPDPSQISSSEVDTGGLPLEDYEMLMNMPQRPIYGVTGRWKLNGEEEVSCFLYPCDAGNADHRTGWRGSLRVLWA